MGDDLSGVVTPQSAAQEKRWRSLWQRRKYEILGTLKKASRKGGMKLYDFSNLTDMPPQEAQLFLKAITDWGANLYISDNSIYVHETIAVTESTHEDLFPVSEILSFGEKKPGLRFGVIADTHFGSRTIDLGALRAAYRHFSDQGIVDVLHAGNVLAGKASKRYRSDRTTQSLEEQVGSLVDQYPSMSGIKTHFILGHADRTFEVGQINPAYEICRARPDFNYLGVVEADLVFNPKGKKPFKVRLYNERPLYTYGISYQPQKKLENMSGGDKPDVLLFSGNCQFWYSRYQGVEAFKLPGFKHQTLEMRDRAYHCDVGFIILNVVVNDKNISTCAEEFPIWQRDNLRKRG